MGGGGFREDSSEMIELDQESPEWTEGPQLPRKLKDFNMVATGQGTFAMGGYDEDDDSRTEVLQLDCPGDQIESCQWKEVGNLQVARARHVSIALPNHINICN